MLKIYNLIEKHQMKMKNLPVLVMFLIQASQAIERHCHNETGRCFWMGTGSKTWDAARTACQSEGGDLAVTETQELWDFVDNRFSFR